MRRPPLVIAHRGASGYLPEHTLPAYALAIAQGADAIEPDLVPTRDGVLVCRHDNALSGSTDVASRHAFARRRCRKQVDGRWVEDWFCEDFSLDELRTLRAREPWPAVRRESAGQDGRFGIPTLAEVIALLRGAGDAGRRVALYPELKHPGWYGHDAVDAVGAPFRCDVARLLVDTLVAAGWTDPSRTWIQSFEASTLRRLGDELLPAAGFRPPRVMLLGAPGEVPWDAAGGLGLPRDRVGPPAPGAPDYAAFQSSEGLAWLAAHGIAAIGPPVAALLPSGADGAGAPLLAAAQAAGLAVHAYTLRAETGAAALGRRLRALGVDGFFIDQPDLGRRIADA